MEATQNQDTSLAVAPLLIDTNQRQSYGVAAADTESGQHKSSLFKLYKRRYMQLFLFCCLALNNNLICYSFAPVSHFAVDFYGGSFHVSVFVTLYFISFVILSFPSSRFLETRGLRAGVVLGAWFQAIGTCIRCLDLQGQTFRGSATDMVVFGQIIASLAQALLVNAPPLVASTWFGEDERTMATTLACNADPLGIAAAYLLCPLIVTEARHMPYLLQIMAIISCALALIVTLLFYDAPPRPPSLTALQRASERDAEIHRDLHEQTQRAHAKSIRRQQSVHRTVARRASSISTPKAPPAIASPNISSTSSNESSSTTNDSVTKFHHQHSNATKSQEVPINIHPDGITEDSDDEEEDDLHLNLDSVSTIDRQTWEFTLQLFKQPGFIHTVIAFATSEAAVNSFSTFMENMLVPGGFSNEYVSLMGAGFVVAALVGSSVMGYLVDKYKVYKPAVVVSFIGAIGSLFYFIVLNSYSGTPSDHIYQMTMCIFLVGLFLGPIQPLVVEMAAEVAYPVPESSCVAIQQIMGNLLSAGLVPVLMLLKDDRTQNMDKANWLLMSIVACSGCFFLFFNGEYKRLAVDTGHA